MAVAASGCVVTRCPWWRARSCLRRSRQGGPRRNGEGPAMTRCPRGGTQTVLTRRPGRGGRGYVSTRCPRSGTQAAMPRRARMTARRVVHDPVPSAGWRTPPSLVDTMVLRVRPCRAVPGAPGRTCNCQSPSGGHINGGWGKDNGLGNRIVSIRICRMRGWIGWGQWASPPAPSPPCGEGDGLPLARE